MAGLLNKPSNEGEQQPDPRMQAGAGEGGGLMREDLADEEQPNVGPDEQQAYDTFVGNGMELLYNENVMPKLLESIRSAEDPAEGLGNAVATLVMRLDDSASKAGQEISGDVKLHAAKELLEQMAEVAEEAGVHEYSEEEMESAFYSALDTYRTTRQAEGKLNPEEFQGDMQEIQAADQEGRIDEVLPGVSEYAARTNQQNEQTSADRGQMQRQ